MTSTAELTSPSSANTPALGTLDRDYTLEHKYSRTDGRIYLSGVQALVRLPLMQRLRDQAAGLDSAGFISGYRGSPLGGFDLELWRARRHLDAAQVKFTPGLNEDLAATMVWGTQQTHLFPGAKVEGVFGMWYGKGPGVDRSGDVFKHANAAGTWRNGGVLALAADDHACRSSTLPHGSEDEFVSAMMPILNPAGVQDILDLGLVGWAMSRYTGRWIGFKTIAETVESSASVQVDPFARSILLPEDFELPPGGLGIRWPDPPLDQEMRLHRYAVRAAQAFARANGIDRVVLDSPNPRLGIVTTGKSYLDGAAGARIPRPGRGRLRRYRHPRLQGRHDLAAGAGRHHPLRPGAAGHRGGGREARLHRAADEGAVLQLAGQCRAAPEHCRQIR